MEETASTPTLAWGIPDGQERPRLPHWRRRRRWRVIDRRELREDVRAERAPHLDVFVLSERHPRRPRLDPDPRQPRSGALPWHRPGRRRRAEPAVDGRPPGGRGRGRCDRVRHRRHEAGSGEAAPKRATHRHPAAEEAQTLSPNALMRNTVALGAVVKLFDIDFRHVESAFKDIWGDKKAEIVQQNIAAAKLGAEAVGQMGGSLNLGLPYSNEAKYLMTGNEAICLGALAAGVK